MSTNRKEIPEKVVAHIAVDYTAIATGVRSNAEKCPIANVLNRKFPSGRARVDYTDCRVDINGKRYHGQLPPTAMAFVAAFDNGGCVQPEEFDVEFKLVE